METRVEFITPEIAIRYLAGNENNRKVSPGVVKQYCESVKRGEWRLNGESIKFDTDGNLLDGQHRLYAIIKAGIGVRTLVTRGLDREVFVTIDIGKKRTASDCLGMIGIADYRNVASTIRMYLKMISAEIGSFLSVSSGDISAITSHINNITNTQVIDELLAINAGDMQLTSDIRHDKKNETAEKAAPYSDIRDEEES